MHMTEKHEWSTTVKNTNTNFFFSYHWNVISLATRWLDYFMSDSSYVNPANNIDSTMLILVYYSTMLILVYYFLPLQNFYAYKVLLDKSTDG